MRKGSLNLSINAIVVLILAITLLGLGLGFVKSMFGSATDKFEVTDQELKSQMIDEIEQSGDKVTFNNMNFKTEAGAPKSFYFGVRNTASSQACFAFKWFCRASLDSECPQDPNSSEGNWSWFDTYDTVSLPGKGSEAFRVEVLPDIPGNYNGYLQVLINRSANDCFTATYGEEFEKKKFYLDVN